MLRLAESCGVKRQDFLKNYFGSELAPNWLDSVRKLPGRAGSISSRSTPTTSCSCAAGSDDLGRGRAAGQRVPPHRRHVQRGEPSVEGEEGDVEANLRLVISIAKNTPTAGCSSSTSSRKAISA